MDMGKEETLFQEIKEINQSISLIQSSLAVIEAKEQPSVNCRNYMHELIDVNSKQIDKVAKNLNELGKKVDTNASKTFWTIISGFGVAILVFISMTWDVIKTAFK